MLLGSMFSSATLTLPLNYQQVTLKVLIADIVGPYSKETHWKQTVFYLNDVLTVDKDDVITGSIAVKKSTANPRELDIKLSYHINNKHHKVDGSQYYRLC